MKLSLALMWTFILVMSIINCCTGGAPTWTMLFLAQSLLVINYWSDYLSWRIFEKPRKKNKKTEQFELGLEKELTKGFAELDRDGD